MEENYPNYWIKWGCGVKINAAALQWLLLKSIKSAFSAVVKIFLLMPVICKVCIWIPFYLTVQRSEGVLAPLPASETPPKVLSEAGLELRNPPLLNLIVVVVDICHLSLSSVGIWIDHRRLYLN